jgi:hypothetical protein
MPLGVLAVPQYLFLEQENAAFWSALLQNVLIEEAGIPEGWDP